MFQFGVLVSQPFEGTKTLVPLVRGGIQHRGAEVFEAMTTGGTQPKNKHYHPNH